MLRTTIRVPLLALLLVSPCLAKDPIRSIEGIVTKVSDGDTIHVMDPLVTKVKVRLYGIDAPETEKSNHITGHVSKAGQPYGEEASRALQGKLQRQLQRQSVRLDVMAIDRHGRLVSI